MVRDKSFNIALVLEVSRHHEIYDEQLGIMCAVTDNDKEQHWDAVTAALGGQKSKRDLQEKWKSIVREFKKDLRRELENSSPKRHYTWQYMQFMREHVAPSAPGTPAQGHNAPSLEQQAQARHLLHGMILIPGFLPPPDSQEADQPNPSVENLATLPPSATTSPNSRPISVASSSDREVRAGAMSPVGVPQGGTFGPDRAANVSSNGLGHSDMDSVMTSPGRYRSDSQTTQTPIPMAPNRNIETITVSSSSSSDDSDSESSALSIHANSSLNDM